MSIIGKILLFLVGFGFGMAFGFYKADPTIINEGNSIDMEYNNKVKKGGEVVIDISDLNQNEKPDTVKKRHKWFK